MTDDELDRLYLRLHGAREMLCLASALVPAHWQANVTGAIRFIDELGVSLCPQVWSKDNQPEYPEPKT